MGKRKKKHKRTVSEIPPAFFERLSEMFSASFSAKVQKTFVERPTTFRVNTIKSSKPEIVNALKNTKLKTKPVTWYDDAFILSSGTKRDLMSLDIYKEGKIYIQSLASMVPPVVMDLHPGERALDLTAAPGSKTSQIAAFMGLKGELVANDVNKVRFFKLKHNLELLGVCTEGVGEEEWGLSLRMEHGSKLCGEYSEYFDKILLDAPCSAEARFVDGKPKTYGYWSPRKIKEMAYKQRTLLLAAWAALKPGGVLVYSTCTMAPEENEVQINRLLKRVGEEARVESVELPGTLRAPILSEWKDKVFSKDIQKCLRVAPTNEIESFFIAKIMKKDLKT